MILLLKCTRYRGEKHRMRRQILKSVAEGHAPPPESQGLALRCHVMQLHAVPVFAPLPPEVVIGRVIYFGSCIFPAKQVWAKIF